MIKVIRVNLKNNPYLIYTGRGASRKISYFIAKEEPGNFCVVLTNKTINRIYRDHIKNIFQPIKHKVIVLPDTEKIKSEKYAFYLIKEIMKYDRLSRKVFICCVGGGVIGDLGGFVASIYKRGIPYIQVPTTLLAQVDASIGGKTAIDTGGIKNSVGTFYQPRAVFSDTIFIRTLGEKEIKEGLAEIIKYGIIKNASLFSFLENQHYLIMKKHMGSLEKVIYQCTYIKAKIVEEDEKERRGIRTILNFGHTIGHALEAALNFSHCSHGEAVSMGMIAASFISWKAGICKEKTARRIENIISLYHLPRKLPVDTNKIMEYLYHDKKFIEGTIRMVLVQRIGKVVVKSDIPPSLVRKSIEYIKSFKT